MEISADDTKIRHPAGFRFWTNLVQEYIKRHGGSLEDFEVIWEMPDYVDDPATYQYPTDLNERYAEFRKFAREFAGRRLMLMTVSTPLSDWMPSCWER